MKHKKNPVSIPIFAALALLSLLSTMHSVYAEGMRNELVVRVSALDLGMNGYIIGSRLSAVQKKAASVNLVNDPYEGTYKFRDAELFIVAAEDDDTVLAVYQRNENADIAQTRKMISGLTGLFGEPTVMAHDKLIYWAYNGQGKIPESQYDDLREKGEKFEVLATVKFSSTVTVTEENPDPEQIGTAYFIISSDPLLQDFIRQ